MLLFPDRRATRNSIEISSKNFLGKHSSFTIFDARSDNMCTESLVTFMTLHSNFVNAMVINEVIFRGKI
jgi:hypothetical protein